MTVNKATANGKFRYSLMASIEPKFSKLLGSLNLSDGPLTTPDAESCLAHLRLLHAFEKLKSRVGLKDGLWDIWDNRASSANNSLDVLVKLREKRWAVYIARAVDRYEAWWKSFPSAMLLQSDMLQGSDTPDKYFNFLHSKPMLWKEENLPPLDVLMVWHAHMLSPRTYLEDCLRYGHGPLWAAGMPWSLVNAALQSKSGFSVSADCEESWEERTERDWENILDPLEKEMQCPSCGVVLRIPWTTCGLPQEYDGDKRPGLSGEGYGDGQLRATCKRCRFELTDDGLSIHRLHEDVSGLVSDGISLPGTVLHIDTGLPCFASESVDDRFFVARTAKQGAFNDVLNMKQLKSQTSQTPSVAGMRRQLEELFATKVSVGSIRYARAWIARYQQTRSFASSDLVGSAMRLGVFHQKMQQTDWVNNQHSKEILDRLLKKYGRFLDVVADNPGRLVVPTLDVDLAWHTHMLSPKTYAAASIRKTGTLLDHPDKIDEDKLSMAFAWTCKIYAEKYGQSYSDCACWYCESVRAMSGELPNTKDLPWSPTAQAAHISAHPSVRALETASQRERTRVLRQEHQTQLLEAHAQILRDARSSRPRTRDVPSGGATVRGADRVDVWGREVQVEGPAASVLAVTTTAAMYAVPPGVGEWPDGEDAGAVGDDGSLSTG